MQPASPDKKLKEKEPVSLRTVLAGFRFIFQNKVILGSISLDMFAVLLGGAVALLPVYAREILHTGPWGLGLLRSAPGVGAVLMATAVAHRPIKRRAGMTMLLCVGAFGVMTIVFGLSHSLILSLIALLLLGASDMVSVIIRGTLISCNSNEMRGRVKRGRHALHRSVERIGRIRVRANRAVARYRPGRGAGRSGDLAGDRHLGMALS